MSTIQVANVWFESTGNNRIQYTGSNTFSIVAAGANTMTFLANGNIGIGTSVPAFNLDIYSTGGQTYTRLNNANTNGASVLYLSTGNGTTSGKYNYIRMLNNDTNAQEWRFGAYGTDNFSFFDQKNSPSVPRVVIDTAGRFLIGGLTSAYASSGEKLTVNGMVTFVSNSNSTGNAPLYVYNTDTTASNNQPFIYMHDGTAIRGQIGCNYTDGAMWLNGAFGIRFRTSSGEIARFDGSGALGIGVTPVYKLHVYANSSYGAAPLGTFQGNSGNAVGVYIINDQTSAYGTLYAHGTTAYSQPNWANSFVIEGVPPDSSSYTVLGTYRGTLVFQTGARNERARIDNSGNISFGTTVATSKFTVAKTNGSANAPIDISVGNTYMHIGGRDWGPSNNGKFMIGMGYTSGTNCPGYIGYEETSTAGYTKGALTFYTRDVTTDTAPSQRLKVSTEGYIVKPYQPGFRAMNPSANAGFDVSFGAVDTAFTSRNSGWNSSTSTFTAPVAGMYLFTFSFLHNTTGASYARVIFKFNGSVSTTYGDTLNDGYNSYGHTSMAMTFQMSAGDTMKLWNEGCAIYGTGYGSFSGFLIG